MGPIHRGKRLSDNLVRGLQSPGEDEMAACIQSGRSPYLGFVFPRNQQHYDRYLTFRSAEKWEIGQWQSGLLTFLRKLSWKYDKPLVLKSPAHTCRIRILLDLFPDARFIHIHRNPYEVFQSTLHLDRVTLNAFALQRQSHERNTWIIQRYKDMYDVFLDETHLIRPERFIEISYADLVQNTAATIASVYAHLGISGFERFRPLLCQYLDSLSGYKTNNYRDVSAPLRQTLGRVWERFFDQWNYSR
jgi:hypothetical protein